MKELLKMLPRNNITQIEDNQLFNTYNLLIQLQ